MLCSDCRCLKDCRAHWARTLLKPSEEHTAMGNPVPPLHKGPVPRSLLSQQTAFNLSWYLTNKQPLVSSTHTANSPEHNGWFPITAGKALTYSQEQDSQSNSLAVLERDWMFAWWNNIHGRISWDKGYKLSDPHATGQNDQWLGSQADKSTSCSLKLLVARSRGHKQKPDNSLWSASWANPLCPQQAPERLGTEWTK